jgi:hypothetical protein
VHQIDLLANICARLSGQLVRARPEPRTARGAEETITVLMLLGRNRMHSERELRMIFMRRCPRLFYSSWMDGRARPATVLSIPGATTGDTISRAFS